MFKQIAEQTYKLFSEKKGNEHIASEGALRYILKYLKRVNARVMLEIGTGIGTVGFAILQGIKKGYLNQGLTYYGTEANEFCIGELRKNIGQQPNFLYFRTFADIPDKLIFNFAVIDGRDEALRRIPERMSRRGIILLEGGRNSQLEELQFSLRAIGKRFIVFREVAFLQRDYGPFQARTHGGVAAIILKPTLFDYFYFAWRRLATFLKTKAREVARLRRIKISIFQ